MLKLHLRKKKKKIVLICEQSLTSENEKSCLNFAVLRLVLVAARITLDSMNSKNGVGLHLHH